MPAMLLSLKRTSMNSHHPTRNDSCSLSDHGATTAATRSGSTFPSGSPRTGRTWGSSVDVAIWGGSRSTTDVGVTRQKHRRRRPQSIGTPSPLDAIPSPFCDPTSLYIHLLGIGRASSSAGAVHTHATNNDFAGGDEFLGEQSPTATALSYDVPAWDGNSLPLHQCADASSMWAGGLQMDLDAGNGGPPFLDEDLSGILGEAAGLEYAKGWGMSYLARIGGRPHSIKLTADADTMMRAQGAAGPAARRAKRRRRAKVASRARGVLGRCAAAAQHTYKQVWTSMVFRLVPLPATDAFPARTPDTVLLDPLDSLWHMEGSDMPLELSLNIHHIATGGNGLDRVRLGRRRSRLGFNGSPSLSILSPHAASPTQRSPAVSILLSNRTPTRTGTISNPDSARESPRVTFTTEFSFEEQQAPPSGKSPSFRLMSSGTRSPLAVPPPLVSRTQELRATGSGVFSPDRRRFVVIGSDEDLHPNAPSPHFEGESPCQGARSPITIGPNSSFTIDLRPTPSAAPLPPDSDPEDDSTNRILVLGDEDGDELPPSILTTSESGRYHADDTAQTPAPPAPTTSAAKYRQAGSRPPHRRSPQLQQDAVVAGGCGTGSCCLQ